MANNFEIGQKVKWTVGRFLCKGIFIEVKDEEFSLVQCCEKSGQRCICKVDVVSELLEKD